MWFDSLYVKMWLMWWICVWFDGLLGLQSSLCIAWFTGFTWFTALSLWHIKQFLSVVLCMVVILVLLFVCVIHLDYTDIIHIRCYRLKNVQMTHDCNVNSIIKPIHILHLRMLLSKALLKLYKKLKLDTIHHSKTWFHKQEQSIILHRDYIPFQQHTFVTSTTSINTLISIIHGIYETLQTHVISRHWPISSISVQII